jgi:hypothetical protein
MRSDNSQQSSAYHRDVNHWTRTAAAGAIAGAIASVTFLIIHAVVIVPIWRGVASGTAMAMVAGAMISSGFSILNSHEPRWVDGFLLGLLLWIALIPATLTTAMLHHRVPEPLEITIGVLATALYGAAMGALFGGKRLIPMTAGALVALAIFVRAGGPLIHFESRRAVLMFAGLLPVTIVFGIALVGAMRVMLPAVRRS